MAHEKGRLAAGQNSEPANDWAKMTYWQAGQEPAKDLQVILLRILSLTLPFATHLERRNPIFFLNVADFPFTSQVHPIEGCLVLT